jgi:O-antigen/teichoic acid export membrane protein
MDGGGEDLARCDDLKLRTARTIKWNVIDRVSSQVLYAVTGIVLARLLSQEDFGLVGAILVFQAFASLMVDSGFSYALLQRKSPTREDYSSVLWFNMAVAVGIYVALWFCAPLIARCFQGDMRLVPLSRVMFFTFILNASAIVQTNRLMKRMDVSMVAVSNVAGLAVGAVVGIWLAVAGYGAWAIVWQSVALSGVKSGVLWATSRWRPQMRCSWASLRSFMGVGSGMMLSSFLNTLFQNIYSFFIGNRVGLVSLGYYTQSDKWSKMGISSLSQVLTSSFLPALSAVQDDCDRFNRAARKMNRFTSYLLFPAVGILIVMAADIFHLLFGTKWDASIVLFQLLLLRGVFTVLTSLYNNYVIALGRSRLIVWLELLRDGGAILALVATLPYIGMETPSDAVYGIKILLYGQLLASAVTWLATLAVTVRVTGASVASYIADCVPYVGFSLVSMAFVWLVRIPLPAVLSMALHFAGAAAIYIVLNRLAESRIQKDAWEYVSARFRKKK